MNCANKLKLFVMENLDIPASYRFFDSEESRACWLERQKSPGQDVGKGLRFTDNHERSGGGNES